MGNFKYIPKEVKDQIVARIKNDGVPVVQLAKEYGISDKTIYSWLRKISVDGISALAYARIKRENKILLELVGKLTLDREKSITFKKN